MSCQIIGTCSDCARQGERGGFCEKCYHRDYWTPYDKYWGYLHNNGSIQVKRWFGDHKDYTEDVLNNEFVVEIVKPFGAKNMEEAKTHIAKELAKIQKDFQI